ncbi:hypothetical protein BGAL_0049g00160 [Botrytis galanthina]|uniref:Uncharacterized protein n=1 Tax=Botrytis galanthina TaxID=278940 RepID=A0A4S8R8C9_9HELO|nr:hypothetical protein BGAL_0049g00160 [Botrytis galanthina]
MEENKVKDLLQRVLRTGSPFPQSTETRQVILIANGIFHDLFNLRKMELMPDLSVLSKKRREHVSGYDSLHHGGNDSNLTLKAIIMLTLESRKNFSWTPEQNQNRALLLSVVRGAAPLAEWQLRKTTKEATIAQKKAFQRNEVQHVGGQR